MCRIAQIRFSDSMLILALLFLIFRQVSCDKTPVLRALYAVIPVVSNTWDTLLHHGINAPHMHNIVLQLLAEGGVIALGLMLYAGWKLLRGGIDLLQKSRATRMFGVTFIAFAASFSMDGMVDFPLLTPKLVGVFLMVLALGDAAMNLYLGRELQPLRDVSPFSRLFRRAGRSSKEAYANIPVEK